MLERERQAGERDDPAPEQLRSPGISVPAASERPQRTVSAATRSPQPQSRSLPAPTQLLQRAELSLSSAEPAPGFTAVVPPAANSPAGPAELDCRIHRAPDPPDSGPLPARLNAPPAGLQPGPGSRPDGSNPAPGLRDRERQPRATELRTIAAYVEALGGRLEISPTLVTSPRPSPS
jgi:hypothetical protein